jgi:hypothetical protein
MIDILLREEALQQASSPEGMEQLIHALLSASSKLDPHVSQLLIELYSKIKTYVRYKRIRQIHLSSHLRQKPFPESYISQVEVHIAKEQYKNVERELRMCMDSRTILHYKRTWGQFFSYNTIIRGEDLRATSER